MERRDHLTRAVENTYIFQIFAEKELTPDRHIPGKSRSQERGVLIPGRAEI